MKHCLNQLKEKKMIFFKLSKKTHFKVTETEISKSIFFCNEEEDCNITTEDYSRIDKIDTTHKNRVIGLVGLCEVNCSTR